MVFVLDVVVLREAEPPSDDIGQRAELHRIVAGSRQAVGRAHHSQHAVERVFHLHARVRDHRRQLLPVVELLPAGAVPGVVPSFVQLRSGRCQYKSCYIKKLNSSSNGSSNSSCHVLGTEKYLRFLSTRPNVYQCCSYMYEVTYFVSYDVSAPTKTYVSQPMGGKTISG